MKRKGVFEFLRQCLYCPNFNNKISNNSHLRVVIENLFANLYWHYGFLDIETLDIENKRKDHHNQLRFSLLYMDSESIQFEDIAYDTFLSSASKVTKYARKYNDSVLKYIEQESVSDKDYKVLLDNTIKTSKL